MDSVFGLARGTYSGKRELVAANRIEMPAAGKAVVTNSKIKVWPVVTDWTEEHKVIAEDQRIEQPATSTNACIRHVTGAAQTAPARIRPESPSAAVDCGRSNDFTRC